MGCAGSRPAAKGEASAPSTKLFEASSSSATAPAPAAVADAPAAATVAAAATAAASEPGPPERQISVPAPAPPASGEPASRQQRWSARVSSMGQRLSRALPDVGPMVTIDVDELRAAVFHVVGTGRMSLAPTQGLTPWTRSPPRAE